MAGGATLRTPRLPPRRTPPEFAINCTRWALSHSRIFRTPRSGPRVMAIAVGFLWLVPPTYAGWFDLSHQACLLVERRHGSVMQSGRSLA